MRKVRSSNLRGNPKLDMERSPTARQRVLKTRATATCGDRHLAAPPFFGRLTDRGVGVAWNAIGTPCGVMSIVRSAFRQFRKRNRTGVRRSFEARWMAFAIGDRDLTFPPIVMQGGPGPRQSHKLLKIGSTPIPATSSKLSGKCR
jgi:hypothetical protein